MIEVHPSVEVIPEIEPTLTGLARALSLVREAFELKEDMGRHAYRLGVIFNELADGEMMKHLGCTSLKAVIESHRLVALPTARRYMELAEHFTEEEVSPKKLGTEKAAALIRHAKVAGGPAPAMILRGGIAIAGKKVEEHTAVSLRDATLRAMTRLRARAEADDDSAQESYAMVRKLGPPLRGAGAPTAELKTVRRRGRYLVRIELDPDEALALWETLFGKKKKRS